MKGVSIVKIVMPRGDIRVVRFTVNNNDGSVSDIDFTEIFVTFKSTFRNDKTIFQKRLSDGTVVKMGDGDYQFTIRAEDTDNLDFRSYAFDIELIYGKTIKQTFTGTLTLTDEATYAANEEVEA